MDVKFIEKLFFKQIRALTLKNLEDSYEIQFSGEWTNNFRAGGAKVW